MGQDYPVQVRARLDEPLSRWLWLVKWLVTWLPAIPHYIVLFFLWIVFAAVTVIAFFAILVTGHTAQIGLRQFAWALLPALALLALWELGKLIARRLAPHDRARAPRRTAVPAHEEE